jgi:hypothetical protein
LRINKCRFKFNRELNFTSFEVKHPSDPSVGRKTRIYGELRKYIATRIDGSTKELGTLNVDSKAIIILQRNLSRSIIKAIVMPLIYGKTSISYSDDLKKFFEKHGIRQTPPNRVLLGLAKKLMDWINEHPAISSAQKFMRGMRALGLIVLDKEQLSIRGPYLTTEIVYYKECIVQHKIYYKTGSSCFKTKSVNLFELERDEFGAPIESTPKNVTAFIRNLVHYLDAVVCHTIVASYTTDISNGKL